MDVPAEAAALELTGVARRFGQRWALRGVSLRIEPGEAVALVGPNGSGKTTLLRIAATSLRPTRGTGRIFGRDLLQEADAVRGLVGLLGHAAGVYDDLSASENLRFGLSMSGQVATRARVMHVLERVGLTPVADERVRGFSAGMRRRLGLARILLRPPRLLLLDEPYASFDADGVGRLNDFVRELKAGGGTALVATHDLDRGTPVLDRVIRLDEGLVVADARFGKERRSIPADGEDLPLAAAPAATLRAARSGGGP